MADIVIFGASMSAQVARTYLERDSDHRVVGFAVDAAYASSEKFDGLPLVPWERLEQTFPPTQVQLLGPISYRRLNEFRRDRYLEGKARGYRFASFIHSSCLAHAEQIGEHCFILAGTIIEPYATIGDNVVIWSGSHIAHHCALGDHCFISGKVGISGATRLGERCFVGGGAIVSEGLTIGDGCLLSFGAVVTKSVPAGSIVRRSAKTGIASVPVERIRHLL
jgi:sugar O-acyltransferase (sialic acid O-acetyltransferase NeuD family)